MAAKVLVIIAFAFIASAVSMSPVDKKRPLDCPLNEKYSKCSLVVCYKTCADLVNRPPCPMVTADCYLPDCVCIEGYLRNENGTCVPTDECPNPTDKQVNYYSYY